MAQSLNVSKTAKSEGATGRLATLTVPSLATLTVPSLATLTVPSLATLTVPSLSYSVVSYLVIILIAL